MERPVLLFRSKPPRSSDTGQWFTSEVDAIESGPKGETRGVRLTGEEAKSLKGGHGRFKVPDRIAARAEPIVREEVERYGHLQRLYADARRMRNALALQTIDCSLPGEMAPVARMLFRHVPEAAARAGVPIQPGEGGSDMRQFKVDMDRARPVATILSGQRETAGMSFAVVPTPATSAMLEMAERDAAPARMAAFVSAGRQSVR